MKQASKKRHRRVDTLADLVADFRRFVAEQGLDTAHGGKLAAVELYAAALPTRRDSIAPETLAEWPLLSAKTLYNQIRRWEVEQFDTLKDRRTGEHNRRRGFFSSHLEHKRWIDIILMAASGTKGARCSDRGLLRLLEQRLQQESLAPTPTLKQVRAYRRQWMDDNRLRILIADSPETYKATIKPAPGKANENLTRPNELVQFDFTKANCMPQSGRRRHVGGAFDVFSRSVVLLLCDIPSAQATCDLLLKYITTYGVPREIQIDNGREFINARFEKTCKALAIKIRRTPAYSGNLKAEIERFWRTFSEQTFPNLDSYVGASPSERQALRERAVFARRGQEDKTLAALGLDDEALDNLVQNFAVVYNNEKHRTLGMSPEAVRARHRGSWARLDPEQVPAVALLLGKPAGRNGTATVTKKGLHIGGRLYQSRDLWSFKVHGDKVKVIEHPTDAGKVLVFRSDDEFLCEAIDPDLLNVSRRELAEIVDKETSRLVKEVRAESRAAKKAANIEATHIASINSRAAQFRNVVGLSNVERHDAPGIVGAQQALDAMQVQTAESAASTSTRPAVAIDFDSGALGTFRDDDDRFAFWSELHERIGSGASLHPNFRRWHDVNAEIYGPQYEQLRDFDQRPATGTDGPKSRFG